MPKPQHRYLAFRRSSVALISTPATAARFFIESTLPGTTRILVYRLLPTAYCLFSLSTTAAELPQEIAPLFQPPARLQNQFGNYSSLLTFTNGTRVQSAADWQKRREEIRTLWQNEIGQWPPLLEKPRFEILNTTNRASFTQHSIRVEVAPNFLLNGYLLIPSRAERTAAPTSSSPSFPSVKHPAVIVPFYDPETSVGLTTNQLRDFASELAKRGFIALAIGSPGGDARKPDTAGAQCQPLHFLGYIAANCHTALATLTNVDPARIAIVGHSYGGKWAMFAAAFHEKFAAGVWSDPGIVFDESRPNINYWEPWYLGADPNITRKPGLPTASNPRTGAYKRLFESGRDLHEIQVLMAPRPFLVSGRSEDPPERWHALNRINEVYNLLNATNRVAMSNRPGHNPTPESNEQIYIFLEHFLKPTSTDAQPAQPPPNIHPPAHAASAPQ
ncbi:MAG TPA: alpha/beta fold hydrolase [Verrucomicrobiae bacterium]